MTLKPDKYINNKGIVPEKICIFPVIEDKSVIQVMGLLFDLVSRYGSDIRVVRDDFAPSSDQFFIVKDRRETPEEAEEKRLSKELNGRIKDAYESGNVEEAKELSKKLRLLEEGNYTQ